MIRRYLTIAAWLSTVAAPAAQAEQPFDAAAAFGARQTVNQLRLSPDGMSVVYVSPGAGQGSIVYTLGLAKGSAARQVMSAGGNPDRLGGCDWVSNQRVVCAIYGVTKASPALEPVPFTRLVSVNADAGNPKVLSQVETAYTRGWQTGGGSVIDWLPEEDGAALIARPHLADDHLGSRIGNSRSGLAVDRIDTRTGSAKNIELPRDGAVEYISDGRGTVRIMGLTTHQGGDQDTGVINYSYRLQGSREWRSLCNYNESDHSGFLPAAVDHDLNLVYGFKKKDGRFAVYSMVLDPTLGENLVYARPDVDVLDLIRIGRRGRVVGVSYATDYRYPVYFDPTVEKIAGALSKALGGNTKISVVDSSLDESKLLVFAGGDVDPGVYYLFDRNARQLQTFLVVRSQLEGVKLATVKPISYPAADGTLVPGYLTLPPGQENAKDLPAVVMPHGGPSSRDEWDFDWLAQFYASRGFAVLQPNYRGSAGYGDAWFKQNGFRSWRAAIGDVLDAGRWLVAQHIADPAKLGVVGWSYGGYAALQSAVVDPGVFKAVVAIAPVTDLQELKEDRRYWSDYNLINDYVGDGPHVREGSPAQNAGKIKVPVLLFHGALDSNVSIKQSKKMAANLQSAGAQCELVTWETLDHQLDDSAARTEMLRKSDAFLRRTMGMTAAASTQ